MEDTVPPVDEVSIGTLEQILAAPDLTEKVVEVPEWGCAVRLKAITKRQQMDIRQAATRGNTLDEGIMEMLMFIAGVAEPKFGREHYGELIQKASGVIDRLLKEILVLSGLDVKETEGLKLTFQGGS